MPARFVQSIAVYDVDGDFVGRLEAYNGEFNRYLPTFLPNADTTLTQGDLRDILNYIEENYPVVIKDLPD